MKIYTKGGDKGTTSLVGGKRVPKDHARLDAYGTVDELISHIGVVRSGLKSEYKQDLLIIQEKLMRCAALLASEGDTVKQLPTVTDDDVLFLEKQIDLMTAQLPELHSFILPGNSYVGSCCHVARCVCRRAERIIIALTRQVEVDEIVHKYINRLSDYLFTLARKIENDEGMTKNLWEH